MSTILTTDVAIVGSGVAGALIASGLARHGIQVTILEAGPEVDRGRAVHTYQHAVAKVPESAYPPVPQAMHPRSDALDEWYCQDGPEPFKSTYLKVVGGTTWHWLGTCLRFVPADFRTQSLYGRGLDWPISYEELEPYYLQAEHELGVSGDSDEALGSPRSGPYPMPPIPQTLVGRMLTQALDGTQYEVRSTPQARNSIVRDGRIACCGSSSCIPVCPVQAKYDATVHLGRALDAGARLKARSTAVRLELAPNGTIDGIHFREWDNTPGILRARHYVLACHSIETPRLLLASEHAGLPGGVANRSGQVGRNLMDHPVQLSWARTRAPIYPYRGPLSTAGIENLRDGDFRRSRAAYRIEIGNDGWNWPTGGPITLVGELVRSGLRGRQLDQALESEASRHIRLSSLMEQEPDPENRVTLDTTRRDMYGVPLPRLNYRIGKYARDGMRAAARDHDRIFHLLKATRVRHAPDFFGAGHILGTTRMGTDPASSVVDAQLRSHDHANLSIVGGGVFPTVGTANPTLTVAALALRCVPDLLARLEHAPALEPESSVV